MRRVKVLVAFASAIGWVSVFGSHAQAQFNNSKVHLSLLYPDAATIAADAGQRIVGSSVEYPASTITNYPGYQIDITDNQLIFTWLKVDAAAFTAADFNGLEFDVLAGPPISAATPAAGSDFAPVDISFLQGGRRLFLNYQGVSTPAGNATSIINLSAVPEPMSAGLAVTAAMAAVATRRRRA